MKELYQIHLDQHEVNQAIKEYVIKKGFKPKEGAIVHMTKNALGISSGAKLTLEKENQEENK